MIDPTKRNEALAIDVFSAIVAACAVAPGIKIVDQVVTEKSADNTRSIFRSALANVSYLFKKPGSFLSQPTFRFVCLVYSGTYIAANSVATLFEFAQKDGTVAKLGVTTGVNMTLGILKDRYFAQVFSGRPPESFPLSSWGLFMGRDVMTMAAGFTLPPIVAKHLHENEVFQSKRVADTVAQMGVPITAQIFLSPIHLLALDLYMEKQSTPAQRIKRVLANAPETIAIRMGRVLFAYGIAGIFNTGMRAKLREMFVSQKQPIMT